MRMELEHPVGDQEALKRLLIGHVPWSPLDFIQGISQVHDKEIWVNQVCGPLAPADDLRLIVEMPPDRRAVILAERLPWDSRFFEYGIGRLQGIFDLSPPFFRPHADYQKAIRALIKLARQKKIAYLFAKVDARDIGVIRSLGLSNFSLIETKLFFYRNTEDFEYPERFGVREAGPDDLPPLEQAAAETVNGYDRFHSDPFIAKRDADRLMRRWVEASVTDRWADLVLVPDAPEPGAFFTIKLNPEHWAQWGISIAHIVLVAVSREFKGWYRRLLVETIYRLKAEGIRVVYTPTQITNSPVIRVLQQLGFLCGRAEHTFRIVL